MTARHALVLADGPIDDIEVIHASWPGWAADVDVVIAADGGARHAAALGRSIDRWVGDGDSIEPAVLKRLADAGVPLDVAPTDKDETDAELALLAAIAHDPPRITVLGALGGARLDHELGNIWLLAHPALHDRDVRLVGPRTRMRLAGAGTTDLGGRIGDVVSLLPFAGDARGITTRGLRYPLLDEDLATGPSRGLSNVRAAADASMTMRQGRLLVVESPARL